MLTVDMILKKAMKGEMDLMTRMAVANELTGVPDCHASAIPSSDNWLTSPT